MPITFRNLGPSDIKGKHIISFLRDLRTFVDRCQMGPRDYEVHLPDAVYYSLVRDVYMYTPSPMMEVDQWITFLGFRVVNAGDNPFAVLPTYAR